MRACTGASRTPCRCIPLSTFQEEKPVWQPFYAERGSVHMYSTLAARGMGPEPRCISAARGGEGRGSAVRRGGLQEKSGNIEREGEEKRKNNKDRPNYGAAPMRNVSTIQLLLSKYLMWPSRLSPAFLCFQRVRKDTIMCVCHICVCVAGSRSS